MTVFSVQSIYIESLGKQTSRENASWKIGNTSLRHYCNNIRYCIYESESQLSPSLSPSLPLFPPLCEVRAQEIIISASTSPP